jgi:glycosyltransferase involved in cell wall biosynthesis
LPFVSSLASGFRINHLFASHGEKLLLPRLNKHNTLLTITKDTHSLSDVERNVTHLKKLKYIVVESEWHRELLLQLGIGSAMIELIYPGISKIPYHEAPKPFKILFATSPPDKYGFLSRGLYLLIEVARRLPQIRFLLVWRERNHRKLRELLGGAPPPNIEILNGYIDNMDEVYQSAHATILPGLTANSLKPCPHSAIESLAHGKPVLISRPTSISRLIEKKGCGVVFDATVDSLEKGILTLTANYDRFREKCHSTIEENFSATFFLERYRQIYERML